VHKAIHADMDGRGIRPAPVRVAIGVHEERGSMIINSGSLSMESFREYQSAHVQSKKIFGDKGGDISKTEEFMTEKNAEGKRVSNGNFMEMLKGQMTDEVTAQMEESMLGLRKNSVSSIAAERAREPKSLQIVRRESLSYLLQRLHDIMRQMRERRLGYGSGEINNDFAADYNKGSGVLFDARVGQVQSAEYEEYYMEKESTCFSTTGKVVTADGREISFGLDLQMSRSFEEYYYSKVDFQPKQEAASLTDPLVINLNSDIAEVSDQKFFFDLDSDGTLDEISQLKSGSGFLAMDHSGDGKINNGSELFGTASGDGFLDLAAYDEDGNGWIDEADSAFDKLMIWTKDKNGEDILYRLKEAGVGAICLENVTTEFAQKTLAENALNAKIQKTGIFLYENGGVGTVQHLDLAT